MPSSWRSRKWRVVLAGFVGVFVLVKVADWLIWLRLPPDIREYCVVRADWDSTRKPINQAKKEDFARRCLEIARRYPGTVGGLSALMAAATSPGLQRRTRSPASVRPATGNRGRRCARPGLRVEHGWVGDPRTLRSSHSFPHAAIPGPSPDRPIACSRLHHHRAANQGRPGAVAALHRGRGPDSRPLRR